MAVLSSRETNLEFAGWDIIFDMAEVIAVAGGIASISQVLVYLAQMTRHAFGFYNSFTEAPRVLRQIKEKLHILQQIIGQFAVLHDQVWRWRSSSYRDERTFATVRESSSIFTQRGEVEMRGGCRRQYQEENETSGLGFEGRACAEQIAAGLEWFWPCFTSSHATSDHVSSFREVPSCEV